MLIASAAAEIAFKPAAYFFARRIGIAVNDLGGRNDHSRCAVTALQSVALPESFLHRVKLAVFHESLDGRDLGAVCLNGQHGARLNCLAVEQNGASSAQRRLASDMSAGQTKHISQVMDKQQARFHLVLVGHTVDTYADSSLIATSLLEFVFTRKEKSIFWFRVQASACRLPTWESKGWTLNYRHT